MKTLFTGLCLLCFAITMHAQTNQLKGKVSDDRGQPLIGVNIKLKNQLIGTTTDVEGSFALSVDQPLPITLVISMVGFETKEVDINTAVTGSIDVILEEDILLAQEIVVSASRVEESILESPVAIEKMNILDIQQAPTQDFYGALVNQKNVDMSTQSFTFRSLALRGFNANGNTRLVQLVDGMDNQAPGLNFAVGNIVGISELDLESVELLPGAASALYGPNAINGIILMNSKSPFDYPGLSAVVKTGVNHVDGTDEDPSPFIETSLRYAGKIGEKFAFKLNGTFLDAEDWRASDFRDRSLDASVTRESSPGYEAINIFGDETSTFLSLGPNGEDILVSRTGFSEEELVDYTARSVKLSGAMHYKFNDRLEGILQVNYGTGQTVYTGIDRYSLQDFELSQYKLELRGENFNVRAYSTQENSGDSYAIGTLGLAMNEALKPSGTWFEEYAAAYAGLIPGTEPLSHAVARSFADRDVAAPGSEAFNAVRDQIIDTPLSEGGAKFLDKTGLYAIEGTYNLSDLIGFADVIVGMNYRQYDLNSEATLFALDNNGDEFNIGEYGGFIQASKRLLDDRLRLTGSLRYDKNENFDGRTTPRISAVYEFLNNHFIRASYQTGFRMPTTQNQYIDLQTPQARLIGGLSFFKDRYGFETNPVYSQEDFNQYVSTFLTVQGQSLAEGQTQEQAFVAASTAATPILDAADDPSNYELELEQNSTIEIGYKSLIQNKVMVDGYYYHSTFNNFGGGLNLFQSSTTPGDPLGLLSPTVYQAAVTLDQEVKSQGAALGVSVALGGNYTLGGNYAWNELIDVEALPEGFQAGFNTPEHKLNFTLANRKVSDRLGFNITWRWQDAFYWESTFAQGDIPAYSTLDAQVTYRLPDLKSVLKVGGSNLSNNRYEQALGNPTVGALYYVSITFDQFMRN
ncbi:MAG: TonB-dependent receptor [Cytophagales bacterium]|nr:TonB-dependent receptor [Cytophagales bacterium]